MNSSLKTFLVGFGITFSVCLMAGICLVVALFVGLAKTTQTVALARATAMYTASPAPTEAPTNTLTPTSTAAPTATATRTLIPRLPTRVITPAPEPLITDTLQLPFPRGNPPTFDPGLATDTASYEVIVEVFSGLVTIDRDLKVAPEIAQSWTVSPDQKVYTFKLRPDAKFQNGRAITAQDFKYSIERTTNPALHAQDAQDNLGDIVGVKDKLQGRANEVRGVKVLDDHTLQITIDAPKAYFLARLATTTAFVVDRQNVEQGGPNWFLHPNGSGPFKLVSYVRNDRIVLERNDLYYGSPKPSVKTITLWMDRRDSFAVRFVKGELDSAKVDPYQAEYVFAPKSPLHDQGTVAPMFRLEYVAMNTKLPPFDDPKVRQAFNMAIDKKQIAENLLRGTALPANGIFPPGFPGFNPDLRGWEYNPLKARELIAESKYHDVKNFPKIRLDVMGWSPLSSVLAGMIRRNLGVDIDVRERESAAFLQDYYKQPNPMQMYYLGRVADYPDPISLELGFGSQSTENRAGYANPAVDKLFDLARGEKDTKKRIALYQKAEQMIVNDAPWIPLLFGDDYWLTKPYVKGLIYPPMVIPRLKYVSVTPHVQEQFVPDIPATD